MKRKARFLGSFVLLPLIAVMGVLATAWSTIHLSLVKSEPSADQHVTDTLSTIHLWFNQEPDETRNKIVLEGPHGEVEMGAAKSTDDPRSVIAEIRGALRTGEYRVHWQVAGSDGDVVRGRFKFSVEASHR